jgi:hypothetical protein
MWQAFLALILIGKSSAISIGYSTENVTLPNVPDFNYRNISFNSLPPALTGLTVGGYYSSLSVSTSGTIDAVFGGTLNSNA